MPDNIKSYEDWSATADQNTDPITNLRGFTDYVRQSYFKAGEMTPEVENDIQTGVFNRATENGIIGDDMADDEKATILSSFNAPAKNQDADAKFVLDHYRLDLDPTNEDPNASILGNYLAAKKVNPEAATQMQDSVNEILSNQDLVRNARVAAVDRGDYKVIGLDNLDGSRSLYSSSGITNEHLFGAVDTMLKTGAIDSTDLPNVSNLTRSVVDGVSTVADADRFNYFANAVGSLAQHDDNISGSILDSSRKFRDTLKDHQETTGEKIWSGVKNAIAAPFEFVGEQVMSGAAGLGLVEEPKPAKQYDDLSASLAKNEAFTKSFTPEEINRFSKDYILRSAKPLYNADDVKTGVAVDSLGIPVVSPALYARKDKFEQAMADSGLTDQQKRMAEGKRDISLEETAPDMKRMILSNDKNAVTAYAQAKAAGKSDVDFIQDWVADDNNYDSFKTRATQFGLSAVRALGDVGLSAFALAGNEQATKTLVSMQQDASRRQEYARLFGDEFGLGQELLDTAPMIGVDIALTVATGGLGTAVKEGVVGTAQAVGRLTTRNVIRAATEGAISKLAPEATSAVAQAIAVGGEANLSRSFTEIGKNLAKDLYGRSAAVAPTIPIAFDRSAGSTYGSVYSQLPDTMSHEEKHKASIGYAIGAGISSAVITAGLSFLGHGGVQDLATGEIRPIGDLAFAEAQKVAGVGKAVIPVGELTYKQAKYIFEQVKNEGQVVSTEAFNKALRQETSGAYKNFIRNTTGKFVDEFVEEALDSAIQIKIEDAALKKDTPLEDQLNQIWTSGVVGGLFGGISSVGKDLAPAAISQFTESDRTTALRAKISVYENIGKRLGESGSPLSANAVQNIISDARAKANESARLDAESKANVEAAKKTEAVTPVGDTPIHFNEVGERMTPEKTGMLVDYVNEPVKAFGHSGILKIDESGSAYLQLDKPLSTGENRLGLGPKLQSSENIISDRTRLMALGQDAGTIKAGTPYVVRDKNRFALPDDVELETHRNQDGDVVGLVVRKAQMVSKPDVTMDLNITDPNMARDIAKHYGIALNKIDAVVSDTTVAPAVEAVETSEMDVSTTNTPVPVATTSSFNLPNDEALKSDSDKQAVAAVVAVLGEDPVISQVLTTPVGDKGLADITPEQIKQTKAKINEINKVVNSATDLSLEVESSLRTSVENLQSKLESAEQVVHTGELKPIEVNSDTENSDSTLALASENPIATPAEPVAVKTPVKRGRKSNAVKAAEAAATVPVVETVEPVFETAAEPVAETKVPDREAVEVQLNTVRDITKVKTSDGRYKSQNELQAEKLKSSFAMQKLEATADGVPDNIRAHHLDITKDLEKAKAATEKRRAELQSQLDELNKTAVIEPNDQQVAASDVAETILTGKPVVEKFKPLSFEGPAPKAEPVVIQPPHETEHGTFRNKEEADVFEDHANNGYMIGSLVNNGFAPDTVNGIAPQKYLIDVRNRLFARIQKIFPPIKYSADTDSIKSGTQWPNLNSSGRGYLDLPVVKVGDDVIAGLFTNDPRTTAAQLDKGLTVRVSAKDMANLNPSINVLNGEVFGVKLNDSDVGVFGTGDVSFRKSTSYTPRDVYKKMKFSAVLREPTTASLKDGGILANGQVAVGGFSFREYIESFRNTTYPADPKSSVFYRGLLSGANLTEINADNAMSDALHDYTLAVKSYGLASKIDAAFKAEQSRNPNASIKDVNVAEIVRNEMVVNGTKPSVENAALLVKDMYPNTEGRTAMGILTGYGESLHERITTGDFAAGLPDVRSTIKPNAKRYQMSQLRNNENGVAVRSLDDEQRARLYENLMDPRSDISEENLRFLDHTNVDELVTTVEDSPELYDSLMGVAEKFTKGISNKDLSSEELVNHLGRILSNANKPEASQLAEEFKDNPNVARMLIDAGWLPTTEFEAAVPPSKARFSMSYLERLPENATEEQIRQFIAEAKELTNGGAGIDFSRGTGLMADAARQVNNAEVERLGLTSDEPDSVLDALKKISETGSEEQKRVADLLLLAPDFIRSVKFLVTDMNDVSVAGLYMKDANLVLLNLSGHNGRGLADVLLHEYLHAVTTDLLQNPVTAEQKAAVSRINDIRNMVGTLAAKTGMDTARFEDALGSNTEFLSQLLTAPEFQSIVRSLTPTGQRSILRRVIDTLMDLFGVKKNDLLGKALGELADFTKMSANFNTFNIDAKRQAYVTSRTTSEALTKLRTVAETIFRRPEMTSFEKAAVTTDPETVIRAALPEGMRLEANPDMIGALGVNRINPDVVMFHPEHIKGITEGLSPANARAALHSAINEEIAHVAADRIYTTADYDNLAKDMGEDMLNDIAHLYYSNLESDHTAREALIAADRASGNLPNSEIAAEFVRMELTHAALGRVRESQMAFLRSNPSFYSKFVEAVKAFVTRLKERFTTHPTASTAAKISLAAREFRRIKNNGVLPEPTRATEGEVGDTVSFESALDGMFAEGDEDRTHYMLPVHTVNNPQKTESFWSRVSAKMQDVPRELKDKIDARDGALSAIVISVKTFEKVYPKLERAALDADVPIEDIRKVFGTTQAMITADMAKDIAAKTDAYISNIPKEITGDERNVLIGNYRADLERAAREKTGSAFIREQQAAAASLRAQGFDELVNRIESFRNELNGYKMKIGFDASNDIYLTRAFKFFTTDAWSRAVRTEGIAMIDGKKVDFGKLRAMAANAFEERVRTDAQAANETISDHEVGLRTVTYLDRYLDSLERGAADSSPVDMDSLRQDLNRYKPKSDFDKVFRDLLGEIDDPLETGVRTLINVGKLAANDDFYKSFAKTVTDLGLADTVSKEGYTQLYSPRLSAELGPLAGLYVRQDIANAFRKEFQVKGRAADANSDSIINSFGRGLAKVSGLAMVSKTLYSVGFYPRNILGAIGLTTAQGILPVTTNMNEAIRTALRANMPEIFGTTVEQAAGLKRLAELQMILDESKGKSSVDLFRGYVESTNDQLDRLLTGMTEAATGKTDTLKSVWQELQSKAGTGVQKIGDFNEFLGKINNVIDGASKLQIYFHELDTFKKAYGDSKPLAELESLAAAKTKRVMVTNSQQLDVTRAFNRSPYALALFPFARWKTEVFRTMYNTPIVAYEELTSGNSVLQVRGAKRLAGFTATLAIEAKVMGTAYSMLFQLLAGSAGSKDDEGNKIVRDLTPEEVIGYKKGLPAWQQNHGLFAQLMSNGKVQVVDMSSILPYSQLTDMFNIGYEGMKSGKGFNMRAMADYVAGDVVGTNLAAETAIELKQNKDGFDQPIWYENDSAPVVFGKQFLHAAKGIIAPSVVLKGMRIFRKGEKDSKTMLIGEFTGARPVQSAINDNIVSAMYRNKSKMDEAVKLLGPVVSGKRIDDADLEKAINNHQSSLNLVQRELRTIILSSRSLGATDADIFASAKHIGYSPKRIAEAIAGTSPTWYPNKVWLQKQYRNAEKQGEDNPTDKVNKTIAIIKKKNTAIDITGPY